MSVTGFTYCNSSYSVNGLGDHHMGDLLKPLLKMSLPYKALWVICLAFTFSEELGFEEGRHGWSCVSINMKSGNILAVCAPSYPFYGRMTSR